MQLANIMSIEGAANLLNADQAARGVQQRQVGSKDHAELLIRQPQVGPVMNPITGRYQQR